jgi:proteasome activator subunit 4
MVWSDSVKGYLQPDDTASPFSWDASCAPTLDAIRQAIDQETWLPKLAALWAQESNGAANTTTDVRSDHVSFIKSLCMFPISIYFSRAALDESRSQDVRGPALG